MLERRGRVGGEALLPERSSTLGFYLLKRIFLVHLLFLLYYAQQKSETEGAVFWSFTCILRWNTFVAESLHKIVPSLTETGEADLLRVVFNRKILKIQPTASTKMTAFAFANFFKAISVLLTR